MLFNIDRHHLYNEGGANSNAPSGVSYQETPRLLEEPMAFAIHHTMDFPFSSDDDPSPTNWPEAELSLQARSDNFTSFHSDVGVSTTALLESDEEDFDTIFDDEESGFENVEGGSFEGRSDCQGFSVRLKEEDYDNNIMLYENVKSVVKVEREDLIVPNVKNEGARGCMANEECRTVGEGKTIPQSRSWVIHSIEQMILPIFQDLSHGQPFSITTASRKTRVEMPKVSQSGTSQPNVVNKELRFLSRKTVRGLTILVRILSIIHEALMHNIIVTKRDIYYKDVGLFGSQNVVDQTASSKGLVYGTIRIVKRNGVVIECGRSTMGHGQESGEESEWDGVNVKVEDEQGMIEDEQGHLIPPLDQIARIETSAQFALVIEKEVGLAFPKFDLPISSIRAIFPNTPLRDHISVPLTKATFRYLISARFCDIVGVDCVLITVSLSKSSIIQSHLCLSTNSFALTTMVHRERVIRPEYPSHISSPSGYCYPPLRQVGLCAAVRDHCRQYDTHTRSGGS
ncbi:hypothetical protein BC938DRAFT_481870 [Jimgerdemannia flammicorona]|uniref:Spo11/DNA topoisomerase VI subunit A N-terminal domain-containing protein n=1 Tax=Jimgerdemannia flammicorona TaxID=994334 RepID=A0A433QFB5_9FUNG|nr:hypothetical protein BC938DRAFT_481870 [Jimgerdemannia flammicorona]